jgi:drug/metabolite transporter (DMT)-like permease
MAEPSHTGTASPARLLTAFLAMYLIWGSTYLAIRFGIESIPPFLMIGSRFLIGGLALYLFARFQRGIRPTLKDWRGASVTGILMLSGGTGLVAWAEQYVPSGLTALLVATVPLWIVVLDWVRPNGCYPGKAVLLGLVLGFGGVAVLISPGFAGSEPINLLGAGVIVIATLLWAGGSLVSRYTAEPDPIAGMGMKMIAGGLALVLISAGRGEFNDFALIDVTLRSWTAFWYQVVLGTTAFAAYLWLLKVSTPAKAATYAYVNPIVALLLGALLANEELSLRIGAASVIIITAVAIIVTRRKPAPKPADLPQPDPCVNRAA